MHIHLVGIGGAGISAIARMLVERGYRVSGSDLQESEFSAELRKLGATIYISHKAEQIAGAEVLVISSAIPPTNPEVVAAHSMGIPVLKRFDFLRELMVDQIGIAIAGTHGKTTTTSMVAQILLDANYDPSIIVGGIMPGLGTNARAGMGDYFIIEADEYDNMFLGLRPEVAIINNIEHDHPDIFESDEAYRAAFRTFAQQLPAHGRLVANSDDECVTQLIDSLDGLFEIYTFGLGADASLRAEQIRPNPIGGSDFIVMEDDNLVGLARLRVPGEHNVRNALAAIAVALDVGIDFSDIQHTLAEFGGVGRRFQEIGNVGGVTVIDDYAHHPTEIQVTLAAAKQRYPARTIWAVWQPHTYTRTKLHFDKFVNSFADADKAIILDIYRSRERDTLGLHASQIVEQMDHPYARYLGSNSSAADYILDRIRPDDVILTLGAGDGNEVGELVLAGLKARLN